MNINIKLQLITIIPVLLALSGVLVITQVQYTALSEQASRTYKESVISHRKIELKNYLAIATGGLEHLVNDRKMPLKQAKQTVQKMLSNMRFGEDGYFYVYDYLGNSLVLPGLESRLNKNWLDLKDPNGVMIVQELIKEAQSGGGYVDYIFNQPSKDGKLGKKLGYAQALEPWQWMVGTGVYIDDIDDQIALLNNSIKQHIDYTSRITLIIGMLAVAMVFGAGLFIRLSENRLANQKLRALNERIFQTQEEECKRVSRELHDGISQSVAAVRFSVETAQLKQQKNMDPQQELTLASELIAKTMVDIRRISHQLHPGVLEDHGLGAALDELGQEFSARTGINVEVIRLSVRNVLTTELKTTLYRITQEALTNIERHAKATQVNISLRLDKAWLVLEICDNGQGFALKSTEKPNEGIGLRNMKERLTYYHGKFKVNSDKTGTTILARIPQSKLRYNADNTGLDKHED